MSAQQSERFKFFIGDIAITAHRAGVNDTPRGFGFILGARLDGVRAWQSKTEQVPRPDGADDDGLGEFIMSIMAPPWPGL